MFEKTPEYLPLPPDDPKRLTIAHPDTDESLPRIGVVGDTYTITVSGDETNGRFCVIDMYVPSGGGPGPIAMTSRNRLSYQLTSLQVHSEVQSCLRENFLRTTTSPRWLSPTR